MDCEASGFANAVGVVHECTLLAIEHQQSDLGFPPTALVLAQRHDAGEIDFREPLDLLAEPCPGATQIGPPRLHLLWQPVPAAGPLHRVRDHLRRG